jgi:hypothetical protein
MKIEKILRFALSCCRQLRQNLGYFKKIFVFRRLFENNNNNRDFPEYSFSKIFSLEIINDFFFGDFILCKFN